MHISFDDDMLDITDPNIIEITIHSSGKVIWINGSGNCLFRACRIKELKIIDHRPKLWWRKVWPF